MFSIHYGWGKTHIKPWGKTPSPYAGRSHLARRKLAGVDDLVGVLDQGVLAHALKRRAREGHEAGSGGLEDAKGSNELEERVDPGLLGRAVRGDMSELILLP